MNRPPTVDSLRSRLVGIIEENNPEIRGALTDDISLIQSGLIDSLALFNLAVWIEEETGSRLDLNAFDPSSEWDTVADILDFIGRNRRSGAPG